MAAHQQLIFSYGNRGIASPSDFDILANADIDAGAEFFAGSGVQLFQDTEWGVSRVYRTPTALMSRSMPTSGGDEFVSTTIRFITPADSDGTIIGYRRVSAAATHMAANYVAGGVLRVLNGTGAANVDSPAGTITVGTVYRLMFYVRCHDTLGEWEIKLFDDNGTLLYTASASGIDTHNGGNLIETLVIGNPAADQETDSVAVDISGAYRGFGHVESITPRAAGNLTQWTRAGTDKLANWRQLTEQPKNTSSRVVSSAADQYDLYPFDPIATSGTPKFVQQIIYARAETAGTRQLKATCRVGGVTHDHATTFSVTSTSADSALVADWPNNPDTGLEWTTAQINAAEFGVKSVTTDAAVQQITIQVLIEPDGQPNIANNYVLCHCDGTDGSTTITEENGLVLTAVGNAQLDTAQAFSGSASILLDGTGDYVTIPWNYAFDLGSRDFYVWAHIRFSAITGDHVIMSCYNNVGNQRGWFFRRTTGNFLTFTWSTNGTGLVTFERAWTPSTDTWYKVGVKRQGNTIWLEVDDVMLGTALVNHDHIFAPTEGLALGAINSSGFTQFFNGWIDEWGLNKGGII